MQRRNRNKPKANKSKKNYKKNRKPFRQKKTNVVTFNGKNCRLFRYPIELLFRESDLRAKLYDLQANTIRKVYVKKTSTGIFCSEKTGYFENPVWRQSVSFINPKELASGMIEELEEETNAYASKLIVFKSNSFVKDLTKESYEILAKDCSLKERTVPGSSILLWSGKNAVHGDCHLLDGNLSGEVDMEIGVYYDTQARRFILSKLIDDHRGEAVKDGEGRKLSGSDRVTKPVVDQQRNNVIAQSSHSGNSGE